ncbi:MAG: LON peptidase substrate-binding domain-containing protein [Opitutales bacterium]|jgi:Lon protease-like protein
MSEELAVPEEIPAMTLPGVVFFPKAMVPLRIFESRYRQMLADVMESHRMFALLGLDENAAEDADAFEPPFKTASAGIVRVCKMNPDGTSNLLLQGISRIRVNDVIREEPYRMIKVEPLETIVDCDKSVIRLELAQLLEENKHLGGDVTNEVLDFLKPLDDEGAYVDLVSFVLSMGTIRKQRLLETLDLTERASLLASHLKAENERLRLLKEALGDFSEDNFESN